MWTFAVLMSLLVSAGFVNPAVAQQADDKNTVQQADETNPPSRETISPGLSAAKANGLVSYQEPSEPLLNTIALHRLGANATRQQLETMAAQVLREWKDHYYHGPDEDAYQKLARNERRALAANSSPAALGLAVTGTLRLFTVAVEFNGTDTATISHPVSTFGDRTCITETLTFNGPLHNSIPKPGPRDNNTYWQPTFEKDHYQQLILSTEGITERVRPDLTDPEDGKPGIDVSGSSMRSYYNEISGGRVQFDAGPRGVIAWIQVPHSEAYYGADTCAGGAPGDIADMEGLPSNPRYGNGAATLVADVVDQINASDPNFPWQDYDTDGNGVIDHVVIFHAGKDKSDGGGQQGWQALWAHRGSLDPDKGGYVVDNGGTPNDPSDDIKLNGYTMQYEDATAGVLVHEFGHDLGLPDLYNIDRNGETDVVWWDLMSTGSHPGKLFGTKPTNMSAWSKFALGWANPTVISPTATTQDIMLGQTSRPPPGTEQAVRVNLPDTEIRYLDLQQGSTLAWWTGNDQDWSDARLTHDVDLTGQTGTITMAFDIDYVIEEDWDYLFVEVSADGGQTYTQTKGFEVGTNKEITTPDNYPDPNGRLGDYGDLKYGYTGDSGGWIRVYHDLSSYAGKQIKVRFRYATDAAFMERGAFIDNIALTANGTSILNDPVENQDGWTPELKTFANEPIVGQGWQLSNGSELKPLYYLLEWRNFNGFDEGLRYTYNTIFSILRDDGSDEWRVDKMASNVPGMLVWLRDTRYGNDPFGANQSVLDTGNQFTASPSEGAKAGLLVVDAHPEPLRAPMHSTVDLGYGAYAFPPLDNWNARVQTTNAAFNLHGTYGMTLTFATGEQTPETTVLTPTFYGALPAVSGFHDALGYFPGVETLPAPVKTFEGETSPGVSVTRLKPYAFSDPDASVVVPAKGYYPPRTPAGFTGRGAETSPPSANVSTFETLILDVDSASLDSSSIGEAGGTDVTGQHSGNPGSDNLQYGYHFVVTDQARDGSTGTVRIYNAQADAQAMGEVGTISGTTPVTITASVQNTGSPRAVVLYSDFDETQATYVDGSATNGAIPVTADQPLIAQIMRTRGVAGLQAVRAQQASDVRAVVWYSAGALDSGERASFTYRVTPKQGVYALRVATYVAGQGISNQDVAQTGTFVYLPQVERAK
jgi:immune inhibitor A